MSTLLPETPTTDVVVPVFEFETIAQKKLWSAPFPHFITFVRQCFMDPMQTAVHDIALNYSRKLEQGGRFKICIWPEHCIIGSSGHNVTKPLPSGSLHLSKV